MRRIVALVVAAGAALLLPAGALAASVSGTVYDDYGMLGVQNVNPSNGQIDNGLPGITVTAYNAANKVLATAKTNATGDYKLSGLPTGAVRVEVEIPTGYYPSQDLTSAGGTVKGASANTTSTLGSDERYLGDFTSPTGVDFGLEIPDEFSVTHPMLYASIQSFGPTTAPLGAIGIEEFPYFAPAGSPGGTTIATSSQVGTTAGMAVDQRTGDVFAAAYYKRSYGLLPPGYYKGLTYPTGAILQVVPGTHKVSLFADVNAGADHHPSQTASFNQWTNDPSWPYVGHEGWGDIATDPAGRNLYGISLFNHALYRFALQGGTKNSTGQVQPASITAIPNPGCAKNTWAPSAVGFDPVTGALYLGGTCTAAISQNPAQLHAYVELVNDPAGKPAFKTVFSFPLSYNRLDNDSEEYPKGSGSTDPANSDWRPWPTLKSIPRSTYPLGPSDATRPQRTTPYGKVNEDSESYPEFGGISFDSSGDMLIFMKDLMGDESFAFGAGQAFSVPQGDLLKACPDSAGSWKLESGGVCGAAPGFHPTVNGTPVPGSKAGVDDAAFGPIGPGGGYFFDPNPGQYETSPDTAAGRGSANPGPALGGPLLIPGFQDVVSTQRDVADSAASPQGPVGGGLVWDNNSTGDYSHFVGDGEPGAVKANGLGDLAAFASIAPVQIGNRVWRDVQGNCTEEAGDPGIKGVVVNLVSPGGATLATATTGAGGTYAFEIQADTSYKIQINPGQKSLHGLKPTCANKAGVDPRITSKGVLVAGRDTADVAPHGAGQDDFAYDFGFVAPPPITVLKQASRGTAHPGDTVDYTITVTNRGRIPTFEVRACDNVPSGLAPAGNSRKKLRHGQICFVTTHPLKPGHSDTFHVKMRVLHPPHCHSHYALKNHAVGTVDGGREAKAVRGIVVECRTPPTPVTG